MLNSIFNTIDPDKALECMLTSHNAKRVYRERRQRRREEQVALRRYHREILVDWICGLTIVLALLVAVAFQVQ